METVSTMTVRIKASKKSHSKKHIAVNPVAVIDELEASLGLDETPLPQEFKRAVPGRTIPVEAIKLATSVIEQNPSRFGEFDSHSMHEAIRFDDEMVPIARRARALADRLDQAIIMKRNKPAEDTLVIYAMMKGIGRMRGNQAVLNHVRDMGKLLRPNRKAKANAANNANAAAKAAANATTAKASAPAAAAQPAVTMIGITPSTPATPPASNGADSTSP
jgi:hypothetical protein